MKIVEVKLNCRAANVAKLDTGAKGAVVTFAEGGPPSLDGLFGYIERLKGAAKLRPDSKLAVSPRLADARGAAQRRAATVARAGEDRRRRRCGKALEPA